MNARTVHGWVVVNKLGYPYLTTLRGTRYLAACAYGEVFYADDSRHRYSVDRFRDGVQVVRCTITTEPK